MALLLGGMLSLSILFLTAPAWAQGRMRIDVVTESTSANTPSTPSISRFAVQSSGEPYSARMSWAALVTEWERTLGRSVRPLSLTNDEALLRAMQLRQIDVAVLSGQLALEAVVSAQMSVVARAQPLAGASGQPYRAVLVASRQGELDTLAELLADPKRWRLARGGRWSFSGFLLPQLQVFWPSGVDMQTHFHSEIVGHAQQMTLAVANGEADVVATSNWELEQFRRQFPVEAERLKVLWQSEPAPPAYVLVRRDAPAAWREHVQAVLLGFGHAPGARGELQRAALAPMLAPGGYVEADDGDLEPVAKLEHAFARRSALQAHWTSEQARAARLSRLADKYAQQLTLLGVRAAQ